MKKDAFVIAVVMPKGGAGKTTLSINLARAFQENGFTPLIIDTDPQASACNWSDDHGANTPPYVTDGQPARLRGAIDKAVGMGLNLIVIDTPPLSGDAGLAAARLADIVVIPCRPQKLDIDALDKLSDNLKLAGNPPAIVILNAVPHLSFHRQQEARKEIEKKGFQVCTQALANLAAWGDAIKVGKTVLEYQPEGRASQEIREVYKQISQLLDKPRSRGESNEYKSRRAV